MYYQQTWTEGPHYTTSRYYPRDGGTVVVPLGDWNIETDDTGRLTIKSFKNGKTFLTITEDEIIIGNPHGENITLKV